MTVRTKALDVLEREFLSLRGKIIEVAAALDRIGRAGGVCDDPRVGRLQRSLELLSQPRETADRAEQVQLIFSLPYDPQWRQPRA
jgi:hypothetical protein